jgi:hypothetical protein
MVASTLLRCLELVVLDIAAFALIFFFLVLIA